MCSGAETYSLYAPPTVDEKKGQVYVRGVNTHTHLPFFFSSTFQSPFRWGDENPSKWQHSGNLALSSTHKKSATNQEKHERRGAAAKVYVLTQPITYLFCHVRSTAIN